MKETKRATAVQIDPIEVARRLWIEACENHAQAKDTAQDADQRASLVRRGRDIAAEARDQAWADMKFAEMAARDRAVIEAKPAGRSR